MEWLPLLKDAAKETALLKRRIKEIMNSKNVFQEVETLST